MDSDSLLKQYEKVLRIRINHSGAGFFCYVTFVLNQLRYCEANNLFPVVYFGPDSEDGPNPFYDEQLGDNIWDYYFEPVAGITFDEIRRRIHDRNDPLWCEHVVQLPSDLLWDLHANDPESIYNYPYGYYKYVEDINGWYHQQRLRARPYLSKYIHPKPHILKKVNDFWSRHLEGHDVLGIHMRGSDKGSADSSASLMRIVKPEEYFPHIDQFLNESPNGRIFLATDQAQFTDQTRARYGDIVVSCEAIRTDGFGDGSNPFQRNDGNAYRKGEEVLIDCLLLAKTRFLLRCTSAVGEYAMYFNEQLKCIDLNHAEAPRAAEPVVASPSAADAVDPDFFKSLVGPGQLFEGAILINLDSRPDRLESTLSELKPYGLDKRVIRMSAYRHEQAMYGCSVSHLEAVRYARWKGWKSVLIFEDDIKMAADFAEHAPAALRDLAARDWGLFQFGMACLDPSQLTHVTPHLFRFTQGEAAHAFALHERTYDYIIENYVCELDRGRDGEREHYHFDTYLNNHLASRFEAYGSTNLLISQRAGYSDVRNAGVDYRHIIEDVYENVQRSARPEPKNSPDSGAARVLGLDEATIIRRNSNCLIEKFDGEILLYHTGQRRTIYLNETMARVWELINGQRSVGEILRLARTATGGNGVSFPNIEEALEQLIQGGALVTLDGGASPSDRAVLFHDLQCLSGFGDRLLDLWAAATIARLHEPEGLLEIRWDDGLQYQGFTGNYSTELFSIEGCRFVNELPAGAAPIEKYFSNSDFNDPCVLGLESGTRQVVLRGGTCWGTNCPDRLYDERDYYQLDSIISLEQIVETYRGMARSTRPEAIVEAGIPDDIARRVGVHVRLQDKLVGDDEASFDMSDATWNSIEQQAMCCIEECISRGEQLFVCSDDASYRASLVERIRSMGGNVVVAAPPATHRRLAGYEALVDFFSLSRCMRIVQMTKYSTFSQAAALIGDVPLVNFFRDENGSGHLLDIWKSALRLVASDV